MKPERVFVDTNLFLRYLTNDVPVQADAVEQLLHRAAKGELVLVSNTLVIAEIIWTLESFYKLSKVNIREKIPAILNTPGLNVANSHRVLQAITTYAKKYRLYRCLQCRLVNGTADGTPSTKNIFPGYPASPCAYRVKMLRPDYPANLTSDQITSRPLC